MKKFLTAFICLLPSKIAVIFLKILGHQVSYSAKIGFSLILVDNLELASKAKIGHFNIIKIPKIKFNELAYIGHFNFINGPFSLLFDKQGAIGNSNNVTRAPNGVTYGEAILKIGELGKITARHKIDMTRSISIGDFSTIAGAGSQIWTHGYIHAQQGADRVRIDGEVIIKDNVYIGAMSVINAGITIKNGITVGSNSTVSKNLTEKGMYVSQKLRFIEKNIDDVRNSLQRVNDTNLVETVYTKN